MTLFYDDGMPYKWIPVEIEIVSDISFSLFPFDNLTCSLTSAVEYCPEIVEYIDEPSTELLELAVSLYPALLKKHPEWLPKIKNVPQDIADTYKKDMVARDAGISI